MNTDQLEALFDEKHDEEFLKFDRVSVKKSGRADLHAFIILDELIPGRTGDMVCSAEHDEIWLDIDADELADKATEGQVVDLIRCGVRLDDGYLAMFV